MNILFAPWRYKYVTRSDGRKKSLFKDLIASSDDEAHFIVHRSEHCVLMLNKYPYSSGHVMIIPKREVPDLEVLTGKEMLDMMELSQLATKALRQIYSPDGFNIGINIGQDAGAGISEHLHMHIVPRWRGDANFMTSVSDTRVVPEDLAVAYKKIKQAISNLRENV